MFLVMSIAEQTSIPGGVATFVKSNFVLKLIALNLSSEIDFAIQCCSKSTREPVLIGSYCSPNGELWEFFKILILLTKAVFIIIGHFNRNALDNQSPIVKKF